MYPLEEAHRIETLRDDVGAEDSKQRVGDLVRGRTVVPVEHIDERVTERVRVHTADYPHAYAGATNGTGIPKPPPQESHEEE
jgi:hypothetical protein